MASRRWGFGVGCGWLRVVAGLALLIAVAVAAVGVEREAARAGGPFTVASVADISDDVPDGVCKSPDFIIFLPMTPPTVVPGVCTLRAAIQEANALPGPGVITLPAGTYTLAVAGTSENASATGDLDITDDLTITGAGAQDTIIDGGAIDGVLDVRSGATVFISGVTLRNGNGSGGGVGMSGGDDLTLVDSVVTLNTGTTGAGIATANTSTLTLLRTTVSDNVASGNGGGIHNRGLLTITESTISDNSALGDHGGGINNASSNTSALVITNSTLSGNSAANLGGAIHHNGTATLLNTTVVENSAPEGGGIWSDPFIAATLLTLENTIVAFNSSADCFGSVTSLGHNLDSDGSCGLSEPGDLSDVDPTLGLLVDNGGPTQTHALFFGSPAIDAGDDGSAPPTDQRGESRLGPSDIGAFEFQGVAGMDGDGDGFDSLATGGTDCDDTDPSAFPGAPEVAGDGVDQDCDGVDLMEEAEKAEPPKEEKPQPPEEEEEKPVEEKPTGGDLVLMGGGEFVFWELIPVLAADVFGTVKIAWLWNPLARDWTSFVPVLGVVNFAVAPRDLLWVVSEGPQTIVVG